MKLDLNTIDVSTLPIELFAIPASQEAQAKYREELAAWELTDKSTASPTPPPNGSISTAEFAARLILKSIKDSYKEGNTGRLRHILRLTKDIETDLPTGILNLGENDLGFIRKSFAKVENWPTQPEDLARFIVLVEDCLKGDTK